MWRAASGGWGAGGDARRLIDSYDRLMEGAIALSGFSPITVPAFGSYLRMGCLASFQRLRPPGLSLAFECL